MRKKLTPWDIGVFGVFGFFAFMLSYMALALFTDIRIEKLRTFVTAHAVKEGTKAAIEQYRTEYDAGEHLPAAKRRIRDKLVRRYIEKLEELTKDDFEEAR